MAVLKWETNFGGISDKWFRTVIDVLRKIDHVAIGTGDTHGRMRCQLLYFVQVLLVKKNRSCVSLICRNYHCEWKCWVNVRSINSICLIRDKKLTAPIVLNTKDRIHRRSIWMKRTKQQKTVSNWEATSTPKSVRLENQSIIINNNGCCYVPGRSPTVGPWPIVKKKRDSSMKAEEIKCSILCTLITDTWYSSTVPVQYPESCDLVGPSP